MPEQEQGMPEGAENFTFPEEDQTTEGQQEQQDVSESTPKETQEKSSKEAYTETPIEWPDEVPDEIRKVLPETLEQGPEISSKIEFVQDSEGRITGAKYRTEDSSKGQGKPEYEEKNISFNYDENGKLEEVRVADESMTYEFDDGPFYVDSVKSGETTYSLKYHRFGENKGTVKKVEVKRESKK